MQRRKFPPPSFGFHEHRFVSAIDFSRAITLPLHSSYATAAPATPACVRVSVLVQCIVPSTFPRVISHRALSVERRLIAPLWKSLAARTRHEKVFSVPTLQQTMNNTSDDWNRKISHMHACIRRRRFGWQYQQVHQPLEGGNWHLSGKFAKKAKATKLDTQKPATTQTLILHRWPLNVVMTSAGNDEW